VRQVERAKRENSALQTRLAVKKFTGEKSQSNLRINFPFSEDALSKEYNLFHHHSPFAARVIIIISKSETRYNVEL
jgi:hypothetical protein